MNTPHPTPADTPADTDIAAPLEPADLLTYERALRRFVRFRTSDPHLVDDIVQETFLHALSRLDGLRDPDRLCAWLFRIAERRIVDVARRGAGREEPLLVDPPVPPWGHGGERYQESGPERGEDRDELGRVLKRLPPSLRRAVRMHYVQGRPMREVARRLDTTVAGVKSRLYRARRLLRGEPAC